MFQIVSDSSVGFSKVWAFFFFYWNYDLFGCLENWGRELFENWDFGRFLADFTIISAVCRMSKVVSFTFSLIL